MHPRLADSRRLLPALLVSIALLSPLGRAHATDPTYVKFNTVLGSMDVQLLSDEAPYTVQNFLAYVDSGAYSSSLIHRSIPSFVIQGGGYFLTSRNQVATIKARAAVGNEFNLHNTAGTLAMALVGSNINSATDEWFFNTVDNTSGLDPQRFTVFGTVANSPSTDVMNALAALPTFDASGLFGGAFTDFPLVDYTLGQQLFIDNLPFVYSIVREPAPVAATVSLSNLSVFNNGTSHVPTITTTPPNLAVALTYNGSPTPPTTTGTYTLTASISSPGYYGATTGTLVVAAQNANPTAATIALGNLATTFDGNPHPVSVTTTPPGLNVDLFYNDLSTPPTAAGKYTVKATIDDASHTGSTTGTMVIAKGTGTITNVTGASATYDGNPHPATVTTSPAGLKVTVTYNGSTTVPYHAGTYKVAAKIADPSVTSTSTGTGTVTITKASAASVTVPSFTVNYSGVAQPVLARTSPPLLTVNYLYNNSTKAPVNTGTYTVSATINDAADFIGNVSGTGTETIAAAPATVTLTASSLLRAYTGKTLAAAATTTPAKLPVSFTYQPVGSANPPTATAPTTAGAYTVAATVTNTNYTGTATGTLTITPAVTTGASSAVTSSGATLAGTVNPGGADATAFFQYGTSTSYGSVTPNQSIPSGTTAVAVTPATLSGLTYGTLYHYRLVAETTGTTTLGTGADKTFLTPGPGIATTVGTALVSATAAQISQSVTPNGLATSVYFVYSTDQNFGTFSMTPTQSIGAGKTAVNVTAFLSDLDPSTTYYYYAVVVQGGQNFNGPHGSVVSSAFDTTVVAKTGDAAPDTNGATFNALGVAGVNDADGVAFNSTLTLNASNPAITAANNAGIWYNFNTGTLSLAAQTGVTAVPGVAGATFSALSNPVFNQNNDVAFEGTLKAANGVTTANNLGVWATNSGTLTLVARKGDATAPLMNAGTGTFSTFTALARTDANTIVVGTVAAGNGITAATNTGLWEGTQEGNLALKLQTGMAVGVKTLASFTIASAQLLVQGQQRSFNSLNGDLAVLGTFSDKTTGIVTNIGGVTALPYKVGDPAPGFSGPTFAKFSSPSINANNRLAFSATMANGGVTAATANAIWAYKPTQMSVELISQAGVVNSTAGGVVDALSDPVQNNNDTIAFTASYKSGGKELTAVLYNPGGVVTRVALTGGAAPGCPSGVTFSAFKSLAIADSGTGESSGGSGARGGPIFLATVAGTGVTTANNTGIWEVDPNGTLQLIVRTGDIVNVSSTNTPNFKTISSLTFLPYTALLGGQNRSFTKGGDLAYTATFSDKTTAIFNVVFP